MEIEFTELTADNWETCAKLTTEEDVREVFVASNTYSIAEAQFYPKAISRAFTAHGEMVGYAMFGEDEDETEAWAIDRFMIAKVYRRKGYGHRALKAILAQGRERGFKKFITSTVTTNEPMQALLRKVGFSTNYEIRDKEYIYFLEDESTHPKRIKP